MLARWAVTLALVGCVESSSVRCPDGTVCPEGNACATVDGETLCVLPDQIASCAGKPALESCGQNLRCYDGVCLAAGCGNGRVDPEEACDDRNTVPNDGCSADCLSDETCGNGVVDFVKLEQCDDGPIARSLSHDGCASDCTVESAVWLTVPPLAEIDGNMAYDPERDRLVLFGDFRSTAQTWEWDGSRWQMQSPRVSPEPRARHAMAYDPVRKRVVMFGGGSFSDTWEWDGTRWTLRTPATSPPARQSHAMAFDPVRKRIVMYGGADALGFSALGDTWAWDGDNWTPITSAESPSPRQRTAMAYDPVRDVIVLFGGFLANNTVNDETWELGASGWARRMPATVPPARSGHGIAFDPRLRSIVMHGGAGGGTRTDTWFWNGTDWSLHPIAGPPLTSPVVMATAFRTGHPIALDDGKTYRWEAGWTLHEDSAQSLAARFSAAGAADVAGRRIVVHGGTETGTVQSTLVWTGSWQRFANLSPTPNPGRVTGAAMAYDIARREFVHFGGVNATTGLTQETWVFSGTTWTLKTPATSPPAVADHMLVYDAARERTVLFGGPTNDTWLWDGTTWTLAQPATRPPARTQGAMAYDPLRRVVVLFGGFTTAPVADTWEWDGTTWTPRPIAGPPTRSAAGLAWDAARKRLVLFGGFSQSQTLSDQWEYDGVTWTQIPTLNIVKARANHVMVSAIGEGGVLSFGGSGESAQSFSDLLWLRWENAAVEELCQLTDGDGDELAGCDDADCWRVCEPDCPPGVSCTSTRGCGDGTCDRVTESCTTCVSDCACGGTWCGNLLCEVGEAAAACPGDCL